MEHKMTYSFLLGSSTFFFCMLLLLLFDRTYERRTLKKAIATWEPQKIEKRRRAMPLYREYKRERPARSFRRPLPLQKRKVSPPLKQRKSPSNYQGCRYPSRLVPCLIVEHDTSSTIAG